MLSYILAKLALYYRGSDDSSKTDRHDASPDQLNNIRTHLEQLLTENKQFFKKDASENGHFLYNALVDVEDNFEKVTELAKALEGQISQFDLSETEKGNGFRSFISIANRSTECVYKVCQEISTQKGTFCFNKKQNIKIVKAWSDVLGSLGNLLKYLLSYMMPCCKDGNLLPESGMEQMEIIKVFNSTPQAPFYSHCLGFHYHESMQKILKALSIIICSFSEAYYCEGGTLQRIKEYIFKGIKYYCDPDFKSQRLINLIQYSSIDFIKSTWAISSTDTCCNAVKSVGPHLSVNHPIDVPSHSIILKNELDEDIQFSIATTLPINCILLSSDVREGMSVGTKGQVHPLSECIIFHCHGGGFVSQSTRSQEVYLREWAVGLGVPILSVDYSLSPDSQYPRPFEEVIHAYMWMLDHFIELGTTGAKIIVTGDSAGGIMVSGLTIKCIEKNIRRPDAIFAAYTPFKNVLAPSPSRILACLDPLLPLGFVLRCLKAYAGTSTTNTFLLPSYENARDTVEITEIPIGDETTLRYRQKSHTVSDNVMKKPDINRNQEYIEDNLKADEKVDVSSKKFLPGVMQDHKRPSIAGIPLGRCKLEENSQTIMEEFNDLKIPNDYYLNILNAPDSILEKFPPTSILTTEFDLCLDDCVMMSKKLRQLEVNVTLDVLPRLPHGFLNLNQLNQEAHQGNKCAINRIRNLINPHQ